MKTTLLSLIGVVLSSGCLAAGKPDPSDGGAPKTEIVARVAPAAPIDLSYQVSSSVVAGQPATFTVTLNTSLASGNLQLKVVKQAGVTLIGNAVRNIDLAAVGRPIELSLTVVPSTEAQRSLVVVATVEVGGELQSRSFRLSLPANN